MPQNNFENFLQKIKMKPSTAVFDLNDYDTIIFDADETIWHITTLTNDHIGANDTIPPYEIISEKKIRDIHQNTIELESGFRKKILDLKNNGKSLYIISAGEKEGVEEDEQPVILILKAFGIYDIFDEVIVDSESPKSEYIKELEEGSTAFIDDKDENLIDVSLNTHAEPIDAKEDHMLFGGNLLKKIIRADFVETKKFIKNDEYLASQNIYTQRNEFGELEFRVNLINGWVTEVGANYRRNNPSGYHVGQVIPHDTLDRFKKYNEENKEHFPKRLDILQQTTDPKIVINDMTAHSDIDDIMQTNDLVLQYVRYNFSESDDMDRLESLINDPKISSKFIAGSIRYLQFMRDDSKFAFVETEALAEQIATYQIYKDFNGHEDSRIEQKIDLVPMRKTDIPIDKREYLDKYIAKNDLDYENEEDKNKIKEVEKKIDKINEFINKEIYMYDEDGNYSSSFQEEFPQYYENSIKIEAKKEDILNKMSEFANKINSDFNQENMAL